MLVVVVVPVVQVRIVGVLMPHRDVVVRMAVRLAQWIVQSMLVLVVCVVAVAVGVVECLVGMAVGMSFGQVEIEAQSHQATGRD